MMDIDDIPRGRVFQYATASGFAVETLNPVLPIFNADDKSVDWFDLSVPSLNNLYFSPYLDPLFRNSYLDKSGVTVLAPVATARSCSDEANTNRVDFTSTQWFDPFESYPSFYIGTTVEEGIQLSRQCLGASESRIIDHKPSRCVLMAGAEYLVSVAQRETTEASARDHVSHLEFVMLSRDHSNPNVFSTLGQRLKAFGGRDGSRTGIFRSCVEFLVALHTRHGFVFPSPLLSAR